MDEVSKSALEIAVEQLAETELKLAEMTQRVADLEGKIAAYEMTKSRYTYPNTRVTWTSAAGGTLYNGAVISPENYIELTTA